MRMLLFVISFFAFSLPSQKVSAAELCNDAAVKIEFLKVVICADSQANEEILIPVAVHLSNINVGRCRVSSDAIENDFIFSALKHNVTTEKITLLPSYQFSKSIGLQLIFPKHYFW